MHPFDSRSLQKLITENAVSGEDFKFISWNDFDAALENDASLFKKLATLNENLNENSETNFIPMSDFGGNGGNNDFYYRVNRGGTNLNKEQINYQE